MAAHAEGEELEQRRPLAAARARGGAAHRLHHRDHVVAVHHRARDAVADAAVGQVGTGVLLGDGGGEAVLVVLDHEQHGQLPHRGQVHGLVEVAFARAAVAAEHGRQAPLAAELRGQGQPVGHGEHGPEVADHADDAPVGQAEVEGPVTALGEPAVLAEELPEQAAQVHAARGEHAEVAVEGKDPVVRLQGEGHPHRDGLLSHPREPFRQAALPQEQQRLLLDEARQEQRAVQPPHAVAVQPDGGWRGGRAPRVAHAGI